MYPHYRILRKCLDGPWTHTEESTDTELGLDQEEGDWYLYFQGSFSFLDWIYNLMFFSKPYKDMKDPFRFHDGFIQKYKAVRQWIYRQLEDEEISELTVAGFSQGAAVALLCAEDLLYRFPSLSIRETVLFGCPKPTDAQGKRILEERLGRIHHYRYGNDIVTELPPWGSRPGETYQLGPAYHPLALSAKDHTRYENIRNEDFARFQA